MGTITEAVERHLQEDLALTDTLARGIANLRRSARWIQQEYDLDGTEEAVVSALRRYRDLHETAPLTRDRELLANTHVNVHTGLTLFTLPRSPQVQQRLTKAWEAIEPRDPIHIWSAHKTFNLLTEKHYEETLKTLFPPGYRTNIQTRVSGVKLQLPPDPEAIALIGHATAALVHSDIPVHQVFTSLPESMLLVSDEHTLEAYESISRLTRQPDSLPD